MGRPALRTGSARAQVGALIFVVAIAAVGAAYLLTPPGVATTSTTGSTTTGETSASSIQSSTQETTSPSLTLSSLSSTASISASSSASSSMSSSSHSSSTTAVPQIQHVIVILMENEEYTGVIGSSSAPYQNSLASKYATAGYYFAIAHPSLPNYLALVGGSTFGVTSDCQPVQCGLPSSATTIGSLLDSHGMSWKDYSESIPANCSQTDSTDGLYYTRHNPFVYFGDITGNDGSGPTSSYCNSHVVSMDQFWVDLQARDLPNYSFIAPNSCDDAHSCPLSTGDQWLSTTVPRIINSSSFSSTALFIVYDEGASTDTAGDGTGTGGGGQVPLILVSPFAKQGYVSEVEYSHYSLLATVEAVFDLGNLGRNDATANVMSDLFSTPIQPR